jgi:holliday junction resolvase Hjr
MGSKGKGTRAERELFHMFWENNIACIRSAGSGSTTRPSSDLLAGNGEKAFAIECKSIKGKSKHFSKEEIEQLLIFSNLFGAEPIIGMRFDSKGWHFLNVNELTSNKNGNYTINFNLCQKQGISFKELIKEYKQTKL